MSGLENVHNLPGKPEQRDQQGNDAATSGNPEVEFGADDAHTLPTITRNSDHQNRETANSEVDPAQDGAYIVSNPSPHDRTPRQNILLHNSHCHGNDSINSAMIPPLRWRPPPPSPSQTRQRGNSAHDAFAPSGSSGYQNRSPNYHLKLPSTSTKDLEDSETQNEDAFDQDDVNMSLAVLMELARDLSLLKSFLRLYKQFDTHLGGETLQSEITLTLY